MTTGYLRCPSCHEKFPYTIGAFPRYCPICAYDTAEDEARRDAAQVTALGEGAAPHYVHSNLAKSADTVYKAMEVGSENRAKMAADITGESVSDHSSLKITNLTDSMSAPQPEITPQNNVSAAAMQAAPATTGFNRNPMIEQFRAGNTRGPSAGTGLATMNQIKSIHSRNR